MRRFSSYGAIETDIHYHVPRKELMNTALENLIGTEPTKGGHYFTVWAPRQAGKTTIMKEMLFKLREDKNYHVAKANLEVLRAEKNIIVVIKTIIKKLNDSADLELEIPNSMEEFEEIFEKKSLKKPLVLILDEFDALEEDIISLLVGVFRNIYNQRKEKENNYYLHSLALIGVRTVLGVENSKGSPFNVQRSMHITKLTKEEVNEMFQWFIKDTGQKIDQAVIDRIFYVTNGQPGLVSWFGELLTEKYNTIWTGEKHVQKTEDLTMKHFNFVYNKALSTLPNNNIINIISKAKKEPYKSKIIEIFKTDSKQKFEFENEEMNYLYMRGAISFESIDGDDFAKFPCQFIQEKLFRRFADDIFSTTGQLLSNPLMKLDDYFTDEKLNIQNIMKLYEEYLQNNKDWLFKDVPRRVNLEIFEAVYHFNLYKYLLDLLDQRTLTLRPEFPTGNGKIDLILDYDKNRYGLELKSFTNSSIHEKNIIQAAKYGKSLALKEIYMITFINVIDDDSRKEYQKSIKNKEFNVIVHVIFIATGKN